MVENKIGRLFYGMLYKNKQNIPSMFTTGLFRYLRRTNVKESQHGGYLATIEHQIGEELRVLERGNLKKISGYGKYINFQLKLITKFCF